MRDRDAMRVAFTMMFTLACTPCRVNQLVLLATAHRILKVKTTVAHPKRNLHGWVRLGISPKAWQRAPIAC